MVHTQPSRIITWQTHPLIETSHEARVYVGMSLGNLHKYPESIMDHSSRQLVNPHVWIIAKRTVYEIVLFILPKEAYK